MIEDSCRTVNRRKANNYIYYYTCIPKTKTFSATYHITRVKFYTYTEKLLYKLTSAFFSVLIIKAIS